MQFLPVECEEGKLCEAATLKSGMEQTRELMSYLSLQQRNRFRSLGGGGGGWGSYRASSLKRINTFGSFEVESYLSSVSSPRRWHAGWERNMCESLRFV